MRITSMVHRLGVAVIAGVMLTAPALADSEVEHFIQDVLDEAEPYLDAPDQETQFDGIRQLVDKYVDMRRVGLFTLGKYARRITPEQKQVYLPLFKEYATGIYQNSLSTYAGERLKVTGSVDRSERDIIVNSEIVNAAPGSQLEHMVVHWRVYRSRDGHLTIVDVGADNIWLAIEQLEQFTSIIANNGGPPAGIDALIADLKEQTADE
jgi:phospholipid transport system substrate-binding protein